MPQLIPNVLSKLSCKTIPAIEWEVVVHFLEKQTENKANKYVLVVGENEIKSSSKMRERSDFIFLDQCELSPYDSTETDWSTINALWSKYFRLATGDFNFLFVHPSHLSKKIPRPQYWKNTSIVIKINDYFPPEDLQKELVQQGYQLDFEVSVAGSFAIRGEVLDILTIDGRFFRIRYFDEQIEKISELDLDSRTEMDGQLPQISLAPAATKGSIANSLASLRELLPAPPHHQRERFERRLLFFQNLEQEKHDSLYYHAWMLSDEKLTTLKTYLDNENTFWVGSSEKLIEKEWQKFVSKLESDFEFHQNEARSSNFFPAASLFFETQLSANDLSLPFSLQLMHPQEKSLHKMTLADWYFLQSGDHVFTGKSGQNSKDQSKDFFQHLVDMQDIPLEIVTNFTQEDFAEIKGEVYQWMPQLAQLTKSVTTTHLSESYFFPELPLFILSLDEIISMFMPPNSSLKQRTHPKKKRKSKNQTDEFFAEALSSLVPGDFLVHSQHGIGKYEGIQQLTFGGQTTDFIILKYKDEDKVYVPVQKFGLVSKYADSTAAVHLESLRNKKFEQEKQRVKNAIKKLAFDLLKLQAQRASQQGFIFSGPGLEYQQFCHEFPYRETEDQLQAMDQIAQDMTSGKPMDRLICGDVGFGKTEVAMRAAFMAAQDGKQVCVLVPTTVLCLQHYHNFMERFKNTAFKIDFISRFKSTKEAAKTLLELEAGKIDIIIGTHQLLSQKTKFKDLGLMIIDEEHRFGVGHKEKLKLMQINVACLTLTATPIPRTLNFSLMGLKELSLIQTPPPGRQAVESIVMRNDPVTIYNAIKRELDRSGQVYFIHNRVHDIELIQVELNKKFPGIKIGLAHGQMPAERLEKIIDEFYEKKLQILIATTIVESGIDVPMANTMIINNAHAFGLAQLHQLRGRVGRSSEKAYCYFVIPDEAKIGTNGLQRIEAIKKFTTLGAGFAIANSDLDIRGAGEVLGAEQSGHMEKIGMELYLEILQEAMDELKSDSPQLVWNVDVQSYLPSFIPDTYIPKEGLRLKFYKKISLAKRPEELNATLEELQFRFGDLPVELKNLFALMSLKLRAKQYGVESLQLKKQEIRLGFYRPFLDKETKFTNDLVEKMLKHTGIYKLTPDYSLFKTTKGEFFFKDLEELLQSLPKPSSTN
jgi:transcription-repair coupling factor (superfamily II helicase)